MVDAQMRNSFEGLMHEVNMTHTLYPRPDSGFYAIMFALQVRIPIFDQNPCNLHAFRI